MTRRIDEEHLEPILKDEKTATGGRRYLYVPHDDALARDYFAGISRRRPDLEFDRITSYNVCYTKLLRAVIFWEEFSFRFLVKTIAKINH